MKIILIKTSARTQLPQPPTLSEAGSPASASGHQTRRQLSDSRAVKTTPVNASLARSCDCFIASSGVKADCVECRKPMYKLKKERDFVENGGRVWHAKCFECERCSRNTVRNTSVDLMGRPCCAEYFNTSLPKPETTRPRTMSTHLEEPEGATAGTLGDMLRGKSGARTREQPRYGSAYPTSRHSTQRHNSKQDCLFNSTPTCSRPSSGLPTSTSADLEDAVAPYSPHPRALNDIHSRKNSENNRSTSLSGLSPPTLLTLNTAAPDPQATPAAHPA